MKILLTGASGYVGSQLAPILLQQGHEIIALVRSEKSRASLTMPNMTILQADLTYPTALSTIPQDIQAAYYLVHSMGSFSSGFEAHEELCAKNFCEALQRTSCSQIIYIGGLIQGPQLSEHMRSRRRVEDILRSSSIPTTIFKAGIIVGSGSASFEIIRDLCEKLPIMIAPKWVASLCQPIAIDDMLFYLTTCLGHKNCLDKTFDVGGPDILSYKEMLQRYSLIRGLKRFIFSIPLLTPKLSCYWLYFVTSTNLSIARALVESLKHDAICSENSIKKTLPHTCFGYDQAIANTFKTIGLKAPRYGCLHTSIRIPSFLTSLPEDCPNIIQTCTWSQRIAELLASKGTFLLETPNRQRLFAQLHEILWLDISIQNWALTIEITFRPRGLFERIYWYLCLPITHFFIYKLLKGLHGKESS